MAISGQVFIPFVENTLFCVTDHFWRHVGFSRKSQHEIAAEKTLIISKEQHRRANIIAQLDKAKLLGSAGIDTVPKKHYGYGVNMFVNITSPLRRYTDLLNMHQLKAALRREPSSPFTLVHQYDILPACQSKSEDISALQRDSARFWILGYLETQWQSDATRLYLAVVLQPRSDSGYGQTRVFLPQFGIEADVQVERPVMRGESIQVRVDFVNPFFDRLILKEAERRVHLF
jgi:exoribonuclease II